MLKFQCLFSAKAKIQQRCLPARVAANRPVNCPDFGSKTLRSVLNQHVMLFVAYAPKCPVQVCHTRNTEGNKTQETMKTAEMFWHEFHKTSLGAMNGLDARVLHSVPQSVTSR